MPRLSNGANDPITTKKQVELRRDLNHRGQTARRRDLNPRKLKQQRTSRKRLTRNRDNHVDPYEDANAENEDQATTGDFWELIRVEELSETPNPWTILSGSPSDPFSTLPSNLPQSFLGRQIQLSRTCLNDMVTNHNPLDHHGNEFALQILSMATQNEALLYSMVSAAMMFDRTSRMVGKESTREVQINSRAIHLLSEQMADSELATRESNIWSVYALGYCGSVAQVRTGELPQQSLLKELQSLHIYGRFVINKAHVLALVKLISMIGGMEKLKTPGMAGAMCFGDLLESTRELRPSFMPFIAFTDAWSRGARLAVTKAERASTNLSLGSLGSSFSTVWSEPHSQLTAALLAAVHHLCDFTILVENYVEGRPAARPPAALTDQRNFTQHSLMSLPTAHDIEIEGDELCDVQYESCRLACVVYSLLVVFPLPPIVGLFEKVTVRLQRSLLNMRPLPSSDQARNKLQLWILVMGALMAIGLPERSWFITELVGLTNKVGLVEFDNFTTLMQGFLWHPKTNSYDGLELWTAVQAAREV